MLAQVLDSATEREGAAQPVDVPKVLDAYNERRFEDAQAACTLSEIGMGGGRSMNPAFAAQLFLAVMLNKTFGRIAPKVTTFTPSLLCSWTNVIHLFAVRLFRDMPSFIFYLHISWMIR